MDLLSIESLSDEQIAAILESGARWAAANRSGGHRADSLAGRIVINLFYENSTRTLMSFAVAAHLEPEILIVDEVLAVGDAEFQKKCMGKMQDVAQVGRTVLFVSHNMGAINALCPRALRMEMGRIVLDGPAPELAANPGSRAAIARLLAAGADVNGTSRAGQTPLMSAAGNSKLSKSPPFDTSSSSSSFSISGTYISATRFFISARVWNIWTIGVRQTRRTPCLGGRWPVRMGRAKPKATA